MSNHYIDLKNKILDIEKKMAQRAPVNKKELQIMLMASIARKQLLNEKEKDEKEQEH